jgi:hypothetical protein
LKPFGIDDARLQAQAGDDLQVVVLQDVLRGLARGRDDHGVEQAGAQHMLEQHRRGVDHHVHALVLELGDALVVDGGGDDGLAGQFLQPELVELMRRRHDHSGLLHRLAQHEAGPLLDRAGGQVDRQRPVLHIVRAGAVELQRLERGQELGHAELQQRVGEHHVLGVLGHRHRQLVVRHARQEHHACVVEVVAELDLGVAHRPFLQDVAEPSADGGQRLFGHRLQLGAVLSRRSGASPHGSGPTHDTTRIDDTRIGAVRPLITPALLKNGCPAADAAQALVERSRAAISRVLHGQDDRLVVVVGPCSIHDHDQAMDYARALKAQADALQDDLLVVMRVYFEKPRTTVGWKGYINDPHLDGSFAINEGLEMARKLLLDVLAWACRWAPSSWTC